MQKKEEYKYLSAFLTLRCNLKCSYCLNDFEEDFTRKRNELSGKEWVLGINKIKPNPEVPITLTGGEPILHNDIIHIINNIKPEWNIDILTNLYPNSPLHKKRLENFLNNINPMRLKRDSPYPSIRVSFHPEQMNPEVLIKNVKEFKEKGFSIGIYGVKHPSPEQQQANTQMQFLCRNNSIDYREKDFVGLYEGKDRFERDFSILYGNFSKYPNSSFQNENKNCLCKTSELLIGPTGEVYKCHRDLYAQKSPIGDISDSNFPAKNIFRRCNKYGNCHPCDVKLTTNYKQETDHTSVEIKNIK